MDEAAFSRDSERSLEDLDRAMDTLVEVHDLEVLHQSGVLTVEIEEPRPAKIVISPNSSASQIWISAQSTSFKLDWARETGDFVFAPTGESLRVLVGRLIGEELGIPPVILSAPER